MAAALAIAADDFDHLPMLGIERPERPFANEPRRDGADLDLEATFDPAILRRAVKGRAGHATGHGHRVGHQCPDRA